MLRQHEKCLLDTFKDKQNIAIAQCLHLSLSTEFTNKQAHTARAFSHSFKPSACTLDELAKHISAGYAYSPSVFNGRRAIANFQRAEVVALDYDTLPEGLTIQALARAIPYACLVHSTASHTAQAPKYRVLIRLSSPLMSATAYSALMRSLVQRYTLNIGEKHFSPDSACVDASRVFFGAVDCAIVVNEDAPLYDASELVQVKPMKAHNQASAKTYTNCIDTHRLHAIAQAPEGTRNDTLFRHSLALAGLAKGRGEALPSEALISAGLSAGLSYSESLATVNSALRYAKPYHSATPTNSLKSSHSEDERAVWSWTSTDELGNWFSLLNRLKLGRTMDYVLQAIHAGKLASTFSLTDMASATGLKYDTVQRAVGILAEASFFHLFDPRHTGAYITTGFTSATPLRGQSTGNRMLIQLAQPSYSALRALVASAIAVKCFKPEVCEDEAQARFNRLMSAYPEAPHKAPRLSVPLFDSAGSPAPLSIGAYNLKLTELALAQAPEGEGMTNKQARAITGLSKQGVINCTKRLASLGVIGIERRTLDIVLDATASLTVQIQRAEAQHKARAIVASARDERGALVARYCLWRGEDELNRLATNAGTAHSITIRFSLPNKYHALKHTVDYHNLPPQPRTRSLYCGTLPRLTARASSLVQRLTAMAEGINHA